MQEPPYRRDTIELFTLSVWNIIERDSEPSRVHEHISSIGEGLRHGTLNTTSATCCPSTIHLRCTTSRLSLQALPTNIYGPWV